MSSTKRNEQNELKQGEQLDAKVVQEGIQLVGANPPEFGQILAPDALRLVEKLARCFESRRRELLALREERQAELDDGKVLHLTSFSKESTKAHDGDWGVAPIPTDLLERKVEITGPTDRKMVINALNSGADVFMADFEDSNSPTWDNMIRGQLNLKDAVRRTITYESPGGKPYRLRPKPATLFVRPRGWHLVERHVLVDGRPVSASIFDFAMHCYHNTEELLRRGTAPYFYLPKLESHLEARLWNEVFCETEDWLRIPHGTIRATVLIETILAAYEMDEILFELRDYSAGLNFGRWDYIFSFIKKFRKRPNFVLPERSQVTMDKAFLRSSVDLLVYTCHRRGIHGIGGMAAQIPRKDAPQANEAALVKVRADKEREVRAGHDGTWVAHPGLVTVAKEIFDSHIHGPHQIQNLREEGRKVTAQDLLKLPAGDITENGLRTNIDVPIIYLESWLRGTGCVAIRYLMEDAATVEISRAQVWQWLRHGARLNDGRVVNRELVQALIAEEVDKIREEVGKEAFETGRFTLAQQIYERLVFGEKFAEFMPLLAYEHLD